MKFNAAFNSTETLQRRSEGLESQFTARHFAVRRAGFLLREYARQQSETDSPSELNSTEQAALDAKRAAEAVAAAAESTEQTIREAEQRGRDQAIAELSTSLDQAILALDAAAAALVQSHINLERELVVPLAKSSIQIGSQIARQVLATPEGLERYVAAVVEAVGSSEQANAALITVHLHPNDIALLELSKVVPSHLRLQADALISPGGVVVGGSDKVIDDRFENRIREVREAALSVAAALSRVAPVAVIADAE